MPGRRAFTLVEVMVSALLAGFILAGVLSSNLQMLRSGVRITQYAEMGAQLRRGLDQFAHDVKIATDIKWNGTSDITLTLPISARTTTQVTYAWTAGTQSFFSVPGADSTVTASRVYLVNGIPPGANGNPGLFFARLDRDGNAATTDLATKRIQLTLALSRQSQTMAATTQDTVAVSYTMRNKATP